MATSISKPAAKSKPIKRPNLTPEARAKLAAKAKAQWAAPDSKLRKAYMAAKVRRPPRRAVQLIEMACGQYGANLTTIARVLQCCPQTLSAWRKRHPEIEHAIQRGRRIEEDRLWGVLFKQATVDENLTACIVALKMKFGHRDSGPVPGQEPESPAQQAAKIRAALRAMKQVDGELGGNSDAPTDIIYE